MIGRNLGHYRILDKLGAGGMGEVYRAEDINLKRHVALKVLLSEVAGSQERLERFQREAEALASLDHPNIVTVYSVEEADGTPFLTMQLVEGKQLSELIPPEGLPPDRAVEIAFGLSAALAAAHDKGVIHRDLKPANIMVDDEGRVRVLDFGLAKSVELETPGEGASDGIDLFSASPTLAKPDQMTAPGMVLGTMPYVSPEQAEGKPVDGRSDLFSFGVVLYEMLCGRRPFQGDSWISLASAIANQEPEPLRATRADLPAGLDQIVRRCLEKDPEARYGSAHELHSALAETRARLRARQIGLGARLRHPAVAIPAVLLVVALVGSGIWFARQSQRVSWARNEALPEIERLVGENDQDAALRLLRKASEIIPDDPYLEEYFEAVATPLALESVPTGATVFVKGYNHPEREWIRVGETPIEGALVPLPARFRVEKEGYVPFEGAPFGGRLTFRLFEEEEMPAGMVHVAGGGSSFGSSESVMIDDFWIDKYEVTNREYKAFVADGGYRDDRFWDPQLDRAVFVDATGRPGPAGWALGSYSDGEDDLPVGGVSWFEASAFAAWAGKSLPTVFHWRLAAQQRIFSEILLWSNFDTDGPAAIGSYAGLGPNGTYDMAGNVREWCLNRSGDARYVLGGAWSEPDYLYRGTDATDPYDRLSINGFRCIRIGGAPSSESVVEIDNPVIDHRRDTWVDDDVFALLLRSFEYDDRELDVQVESSDDTPDFWRHEFVSVLSAYGDERLPVHVYLPKDADPPYQAVVYFPPSSARFLTDSLRPSFPMGYFIPKSGRALVYPIFKGTYGRRVERRGPNDARDLLIQQAKDLRRTIDYLETRADIDSDKLAYYGVSWGAYLGPVMTAIEPRFDASILLAGGLWRPPDGWPAVAVPQNFAPRLAVPTVLINGKKDFGAPVETNIQPLFDMLGTPAEHKRLVLLEGGHVPASPNKVIRAVLDWLDLYLGPVSPAG